MSVLSTVACFHNLPPDALLRLERGGYAVNPRDGEQIFPQGNPANEVYAIVAGDGRVRIGSSSAQSKSLMAQLFSAGDIFGEIGVIDGGVRSAEAVALGRVRLWRISSTAFIEVLNSTPALGVALARLLCQRLRRTYTMLQDATFATVEVRLARQVLYLAGLNGRRTEFGTQLAGRFRQGDLADLLGTTPRSIITILNSWRASGVVTYDTNTAQLTVHNETELRKLVQDS